MKNKGDILASILSDFNLSTATGWMFSSNRVFISFKRVIALPAWLKPLVAGGRYGKNKNGSQWEPFTQHRTVHASPSTSHFNVPTALEAPGGFEPPHKGFADLSLTTWVRRQENCRLTMVRLRSPQVYDCRLKNCASAESEVLCHTPGTTANR